MLQIVLLVVGLVLLALLSRSPKDPSTTVQDRGILAMRTLFSDLAPGFGQLTVVMYFGRAPLLSDVVTVVREAVAKYPRLRQAVRPSRFMFAAGFREHPTFEVSDLCFERRVDDVEQSVAELANEDVVSSEAVWRIDVLRGDRDALMIRVNHGVGDGLRLVNLAGDLLQFKDGTRAQVPVLKRLGKSNGAKKPLLRDLATAAVLDRMPDETAPLYHAPGKVLSTQARRHKARRVASLAMLKTLKQVYGTTLNDIILCAFCGALPKRRRGTTRAFMAVALPQTDDGQLYNHFVMPSMELPDEENRTKRLDAVRAIMADIKTSNVAACVAALAMCLERVGLDVAIGDAQLRLFTKHSLIYSNVPGFDDAVYFADCKVDDFGLFFPNFQTQCIFFSYDGHLSLHISADAEKGKDDPFAIFDRFTAEVQAWHAEASK